jgi:hypothetical protein
LRYNAAARRSTLASTHPDLATPRDELARALDEPAWRYAAGGLVAKAELPEDVDRT